MPGAWFSFASPDPGARAEFGRQQAPAWQCQKYAMIFLTNMDTIANRILARAKRHGAGWVFSAKHLSDLGDRAAVDQALSRLARDRRIRRVTRGLYDLPRIHPALGPLSPDLDA